MTDTTPTPVPPADALKYIAALVTERTDWTTDAISGSGCNRSHEIEVDAIDAMVREIVNLARQYGDPRVYSDGRQVRTTTRIHSCGLTSAHVWHPDPTAEAPQTWGGSLLHDPGTPSPGVFSVTTDPATQRVHVNTVVPFREGGDR
jgi:hypothetical protein